jgi:hypothetical protein
MIPRRIDPANQDKPVGTPKKFAIHGTRKIRPKNP